MECKVDGCTRHADYKEAQLCQKHYFRMWRNGTTDLVRKKAKERQENPQGYQWIHRPTHPLRHPKTGYVAEHRAVLYEALGDGPLNCALCQKSLTWKTCHVDHIDNNVRNNDLANLRPTCSTCNTRRGMKPPAEWSWTTAIEYDGVTLTAHEWSRNPLVNVTGSTIRRRLASGMSAEQALFAPKVTHKSKLKELQK